MSQIQYRKLLLAIVVICCFALVGIAIAFRNVWLSILFLVVGFLLMGVGIRSKNHVNTDN